MQVEQETFILRKEDFQLELSRILGWWEVYAIDRDYGGFIGLMNDQGIVQPNAPKGSVLNARILWSFSSGARILEGHFRQCADRAYNYFIDNFIDGDHGGVYWMLDHEGKVVDSRKQIYAQAFAIYGLTEYHMLTGSSQSLEYAMGIFDSIEKHGRDCSYDGYFEALDREWKFTDEFRLSEKEGYDKKTMNTHLHLLEAYTSLASCINTPGVNQALEDLLRLYKERFFDRQSGRLKLFFDEQWNERFVHESYGHEIESAWLMNEAAACLDDTTLVNNTGIFSGSVADHVIDLGLDESGAVINERTAKGELSEEFDWWPQAEGVIGFFDCWEKTGNRKYYRASARCWAYIKSFLIDRENGEWHWACDGAGIPVPDHNKIGPWKGPYHNTRMCIELIKRLHE